ncbi:Heat shock protein DnaJ [Heracleum sosnowskyi]|uniref:Heat shock protein DnaJ n=1 Tax=Heracleum sosnowskyi TaxID=360622 RepID=A0AAD8H584_9APIA|nr:Heat shock protein DnaJ [Heracleum sosnowskyi]
MAGSKFSQREQPYHLRSKNHMSRESCAVQSKIPKFSDSLVTKLNHQQSTPPDMLNSKQTFEICPNCTTKFQYTKDTSNRPCCPSCSEQIVVNDSSPQSAVPQANKGKSNAPAVKLHSTRGPPALCQQKRVPKWEAINLGPRKTKGLDVDDAILKTRGKEYQRVSTEDTVLPSANVNPRESGNLGSTKRRREIDSGSGSVGRFDTRSGSSCPDPEKIADNVFARMMSELYNVHIPEEDGYMSFNSESKKSRLSSNPSEDLNQQNVDNAEVELCDSAGNQETLDNLVVELCNSAGIPPSADLCKGTSKQKSNLNLEFQPELNYYVSAEPKCSNFAKDKEEKNFSVDQIWACYDCVDSMPRFYAKIRKVRSPKEVQITWLEPQPEGQSEIDWVKTGLPVACGKFAYSSSEDTLSHLCFSHQIRAKNLSASHYVIYPRKGETWAIFKDWNITWKSDPKNHDQFQFEIVEVVSDFNNSTGVKIAHLEKVYGFLSLFRRKTQVGSPYLRILSGELLKFSHQVPSFRINESDTDGVPKGCLELDPASLPDSLTIMCFPGKVITEIGSRDTVKRSGEGQVNCTTNSMILKTATKVVGLVTECSPGSTRRERSKQLGSFQDQGSANFFTSKRNGSLDTNFQRTRLVADCSHCSAPKGSSKDFDGFKDQEFDNLGPFKKHGSSDKSPSNVSGSLIISPDFSADALASEAFHDFSEDKSITKFKPGQLWALYGQKDDNAKIYVQVTNVESALMIVYATLLESTHPPPSSCGMFRVCKGEPEIFFPSSFSHKVKAKQFGDDKYAICPWKGEIWAMHKSWNDRHLGFVLQGSEFDVVEVLKCNKDYIEVSSLIPQVGFKSCFMAPSKLRYRTDTRKILWSEISLFSHRIPDFQLNDEHSNLVAGCVQLDPVAFPVNMFK